MNQNREIIQPEITLMKRNVHAFRIHRSFALLQRYSFALLLGYLHEYSWMQLLCILYTVMHCRTMGANNVHSETLFYTLMGSAVCILGWQYTVFFLRHHCTLWIGIMYSWMEAHVSMTRGVSQGRVDSSTLTLEIPAASLQ